MKVLKNKKIYIVEWHDAHSSSSWHTEDEVKKFIDEDKCICETIGYIINETKEEITMACRRMKWAQEGDCQWGLLQKIPKSWIRKKIIANTKNESIRIRH